MPLSLTPGDYPSTVRAIPTLHGVCATFNSFGMDQIYTNEFRPFLEDFSKVHICKNYSIIKENKSFFLFEVFDILGDSNIPLMWKYGGQTITLAFRAHSDLFHETRNFEELKVSLNGPGNAFHTL